MSEQEVVAVTIYNIVLVTVLGLLAIKLTPWVLVGLITLAQTSNKIVIEGPNHKTVRVHTNDLSKGDIRRAVKVASDE